MNFSNTRISSRQSQKVPYLAVQVGFLRVRQCDLATRLGEYLFFFLKNTCRGRILGQSPSPKFTEVSPCQEQDLIHSRCSLNVLQYNGLLSLSWSD